MALAEASYELGTLSGLTMARVDFDEPQSSGYIPSTIQNATVDGTVRLGVRLTVQPAGDAGSSTVLEMGTAYPGFGYLFSYALVDDDLVYAGPLRTNRKTGIAYAIRRRNPGEAWGFYENGTLRGARVLDTSYVEITEVFAFAAADDIDNGPVLYPATVKLRAGYAYGDPDPWPAGWEGSFLSDDPAICGAVLDAMIAKVAFLINYGDCVNVADSTQQADIGNPPVPLMPAPVGPTAWEDRTNLTGKPDRIPDGYTGADVVIEELQA